jgi:putative multiple sugar transport system ATP-binding protein
MICPQGGGEVVLEVKNWTAYDPAVGRTILKDVNFNVKKGEIVGFAGLMGSGRTELALSLFGNPKGYRISGEALIGGKSKHFTHPEGAIKGGMAYVTEDRKGAGLILIQDVKQNITLANLREIARRSIVDGNLEIQVAEQYRSSLNIKTPTVEQRSATSAAATSKKLGKWLFVKPTGFILMSRRAALTSARNMRSTRL